jgi:hypothetical protein
VRSKPLLNVMSDCVDKNKIKICVESGRERQLKQSSSCVISTLSMCRLEAQYGGRGKWRMHSAMYVLVTKMQ